MKKLILVIIIISLFFVSCSKGIKSALNMPNDEGVTENADTQTNDTLNVEVGQKIYKEVSVNNQTVSKWLVVNNIEEYEYDRKGNLIHYKNNAGMEECWEEWWEYDRKGKLIHYKDSIGDKLWCECDSKGNLIHCKDSTGYELWCECDSKGNLIHCKDSDDYEEWWKYDNKGNLIHCKDNDGHELWCEYDSKGNKIHYKSSGKIYDFRILREYEEYGHKHKYSPNILNQEGFERVLNLSGYIDSFSIYNDNELWYEYDSQGNMIHCKDSHDNELCYEYDSQGNMIHYKDSYDNELWCEYGSQGSKIRHKKFGYECCFEYDSKGNLIHCKDSTGDELWLEYDSKGKLIHYKDKDSYDQEGWFEYTFWKNGKVKQYVTYTAE